MSKKVINLGDYSEYQKIKYPGGELQVRLKYNYYGLTHIVARIQSTEDLVETVLLKDAVDYIGSSRLILPYLPYSRADRRAENMPDCLGKQVFLDMIKAKAGDDDFRKTVTLDAHSDILEERYINRSARPFIEKAAKEFAADKGAVCLLYPDKGAAKRYDIKSIDGLAVKTLYCEKVRDEATGKLSNFKVPEYEEFFALGGTLPILVVDDICDGGGTFIGIAKALQDKGVFRPLGLYVTHGIFAKGVDPLYDAGYKKIFTTNSFRTYPLTYGLTVYDCIPYLLAQDL